MEATTLRSIDGEFFRFSNITFLPRPVQRPGVPVWVGGESNAALRRAARIGDAWYPDPYQPAPSAQHRRPVPRWRAPPARALAERHGRDPGSIGLAVWSNSYDETRPEQRVDGEHHLLTGGADALVDDIGTLAEVGVGQVLLNFQRADLERSLESMQRFADDVMAKVA